MYSKNYKIYKASDYDIIGNVDNLMDKMIEFVEKGCVTSDGRSLTYTAYEYWDGELNSKFGPGSIEHIIQENLKTHMLDGVLSYSLHKNEATIQDLCVRQGYRGGTDIKEKDKKYIGSSLVKMFEKQLPLHVDTIKVFAVSVAIPFYEKMKFEFKEPTNKGLSYGAHLMIKKIKYKSKSKSRSKSRSKSKSKSRSPKRKTRQRSRSKSRSPKRKTRRKTRQKSRSKSPKKIVLRRSTRKRR
jgi:hypothetical protein